MGDLRTAITKEGQAYVDEPVVVQPKHEAVVTPQEIPKEQAALYDVVAEQLAAQAFEREGAPPVPHVFANPRAVVKNEVKTFLTAAAGVSVKRPILIGHERVRLRWMKPDGKGGLVPK